MSYLRKTIIYCFYALFFLVPLVLSQSTSELFELNKMWLTWGITIIIGGSWLSLMFLEKKWLFKRTPLDIPLGLFLLSQLISTIFSLDPRISLWGYYSRFNGGFLSLLSYIFLYYAFVTFMDKKSTLRVLFISLFSGLCVVLWGIPAHFGSDPTCLLFRGTLDVSCWTEAFKPTVRIFSTLGQPAWMAAYLAVLLPLAVSYVLQYFSSSSQPEQSSKFHPPAGGQNSKLVWRNPYAICYVLLAILFYLALIFANTRAGFMAFWIANAVFWVLLFLKKVFTSKEFFKLFIGFTVLFVLLSFFFGIPVDQLSQYTWQELSQRMSQAPTASVQKTTPQKAVSTDVSPSGAYGITDSGNIRLIVWQGSLDAWKSNPVFGTGVETFAFAYYKYRPAAHNMTSEWDYLYNKAHNEYLNYLTTTGIFGLGTYFSIIGVFSFLFLKYLLKKIADKKELLLSLSLFAGYISILVSNFFGFSVVIINLYFFLIPAFFFLLNDAFIPPLVSANNKKPTYYTGFGAGAWIGVITIGIVSAYMLLALLRFWYADQAYALGSNLDRAGQYQQAYQHLKDAVDLRPAEPVFKDELAINSATLANAYAQQKQGTQAAQLGQQAITLSNNIVTSHPNNIVFWKSRVRLFYALSQIDQSFLTQALTSMQQAASLAPTDAKVFYNLAVLYEQTGNPDKAIETMKKTISLKKDYKEAYYALGLFYHDKSEKATNPTEKQEFLKKALDTLHYSLENIAPGDKQIEKTIKEWETGK